MRMTVYKQTALADESNRAAAEKQLHLSDPELFAGCDSDEREQWIDDVIIEWVDQYRQKVAESLHPC